MTQETRTGRFVDYQRLARLVSQEAAPASYLPPFQLRNASGKNPREKSGHTKLRELGSHPSLHLVNGDVWKKEMSILKTMTAIHRALGSICVCAAASLVAFQGHSTTLAIFIFCLHKRM